jgi:head-tail adaptor
MSGIGDYVHLVELDKPTATPDDPEGGYTPQYVPLDPPTWYCSIQAATARDLERISGGAQTQLATHLIRGPYHPQLTADCRITFRDRVFEVGSVQDRDQLQVELDVIAHELIGAAPAPARRRQDDAG